MSGWGYTFENSLGVVLAYVESLSGMTLTMPLNGPAVLSGTLLHSSRDMEVLYSTIATEALFLRAAKDGVTRFWGALNDASVSLAEDGQAQVTFTDLSGLHSSVANYVIGGNKITPFYKRNSPTWTATIDSLLAQGNPLVRLTRSGSPTGRIPTNDTRANATGHLKLKGNVWKAQSSTVLDSLQELSGYATGVEWYVTPDDTLTVGNTLGTNKSGSVRFQYGSLGLGNVMTVSNQFQPPVNSLFWADTKGVLHRSATGYSLSSITAFSEYSTTFNYMSRRNQSDDDRAAAHLRTGWRQVTSLVADPTRAPQPWTDYFLGDTVSVRVQRDSLDSTKNLRVNEILISCNELGVETSHQLSFEVL